LCQADLGTNSNLNAKTFPNKFMLEYSGP